MSGKTSGANELSLNLVVVPPKGKAEPHTHREFESAVYVIIGRAIHQWGDRLQQSMETKAGDFLFVAPGVPHYPENPYDEPVIAVVARNDPDEQEHVIPLRPALIAGGASPDRCQRCATIRRVDASLAMRQVKEYVPPVTLLCSRRLVHAIVLGILSFACGASSTAPNPTGPVQTTAPAQTTAASEQPPIVESLPSASGPAQPGLKLSCQQTPDTLSQSPTCPVLRWLGLTYWAYSHIDNRLGMTIVAYDSAGTVVKQWERPGARYVWRIAVDATARTVTYWGQASNTILMTWDELKQR